MERKQINKKGVLGLETVRMFMIVVLTLAVVAIGIFIGLAGVVNNNTVLNSRTISDNYQRNNSFTVNDTARQIPFLNSINGTNNQRNPVLSLASLVDIHICRYFT